MPLTRRAFTVGASASLALTVLGCGSDEPESSGNAPAANRPAGRLTATPFAAGALADLTAAGVYDQHAQDKGVFLVSDGSTLVALSAECTHNRCGVALTGNEFVCPCHGSKFKKDGAVEPNMKASMPLVRLGISVDDTGTVQVDPTKKFSEGDGNRDDEAAMVKLG